MPVSKLRITKEGVLVGIIETSSTPEELKAERYASQDVVIEQLDADGNVVASMVTNIDETAAAEAAENAEQ